MSKKYIIKNGKAVEVSEELHDYLTKSDRKIRYIAEPITATGKARRNHDCWHLRKGVVKWENPKIRSCKVRKIRRLREIVRGSRIK